MQKDLPHHIYVKAHRQQAMTLQTEKLFLSETVSMPSVHHGGSVLHDNLPLKTLPKVATPENKHSWVR